MGHDKSEEKGLICTPADAGAEKKYTQKEDLSTVNTHFKSYANLRVFLKAESRKEDFVGRKSR